MNIDEFYLAMCDAFKQHPGQESLSFVGGSSVVQYSLPYCQFRRCSPYACKFCAGMLVIEWATAMHLALWNVLQHGIY